MPPIAPLRPRPGPSQTSGPSPCPKLGFDLTEPIYSESVAFFIVSDDATSVVSLRLCRYPAASTAWLWAHVFTPDVEFVYNVDHLPCDDRQLDVEADDLAYTATDDLPVRFQRNGPRVAPAGGEVDLTVIAHRGCEAPDADGDVPVRVHGSFTPGAAAGATLEGRSELLGAGLVTVESPDRPPFTVSGRAQFHEQHQDRPRFVVPFTYASLRGEDLSVIALIGKHASGGFARGIDGDRRLTEARIPEPIGDEHPIELVDDSGHRLHGIAHVSRSFTLPLYGQPWWGTIVTAELGGRQLSGSINRWRFEA